MQSLRPVFRRSSPVGIQPSHLQNAVAGDPRVNIQNAKGKAKPYQVRQVLQAIERLEAEHG